MLTMDINVDNVKDLLIIGTKIAIFAGSALLLGISFFQMKEARKMSRKLGIILPGVITYSLKLHLVLILFLLILSFALIVIF